MACSVAFGPTTEAGWVQKDFLRDHPLQAAWPFWRVPPSGLRGRPRPRPRPRSACLCPPTIIHTPGPASSLWLAHEPSHPLHSAWTMQYLPERRQVGPSAESCAI